MSDNDPETIAVEKEKHLKEEASVRWNEKLASHSEAAVSTTGEIKIEHEHRELNMVKIFRNRLRLTSPKKSL